MRNQTVWLLAVLLGVFAVFLIVPEGQLLPIERMVAQVGITVGVAPNPYNTLDAQLNQKQEQLDQEASDLATQEASMTNGTAETDPATTPVVVWYLTAAIVVILLLVMLNFYLDWRRSRSKTEKNSVVPSDPEKPKE